MKKFISLPITIESEGFCNYTGPIEITITKTKFQELCKKYGHAWDLIAPTQLKYFKNNSWHYAKI